MKISIICRETSWIYGKFIENFQKHSCHEILVNSQIADIIHFLPYYELFITPRKTTAWFSHKEDRSPLDQKFISAANSVKCAISQSKKYLDLIQDVSYVPAIQIAPGVDQEFFRTKPTSNKTKPKKLNVGYIGRHYASNRKNPALLNRIAQLPFVNFLATNGKIPDHKVPDFYRQCNLIVSPALIEGGPMAITESLATGIPILCYRSVGVADEFGTGVIKVPFNQPDDYIRRLEQFWNDDEYLIYDDKKIDEMRDQVRGYTWESFVKKHDDLWRSL